MTPVIAAFIMGGGVGVVLTYFAMRPDPRPASEEPCGHRRNPHQFPKWEDCGTATLFAYHPIHGKYERGTASLQERRCERCGLLDRRKVEIVAEDEE